MMDYVIETKNLTRYYGSRSVVSSLDLRIPRGGVYGFLGRNGSGKSTTIKMLLGFVAPTRGSSSIFGEDSMALSPKTRGRIGYLSEGHPVYGWMSVAECREFQRGTYGKWNDDIFTEVIAHFGLGLKDKAKNLSRGQRAGLCLALTLAPEPELLILDDPALGLDPAARRVLLQAMVFATSESNRTILFSSHMLADVERAADRIAVLDHGVLRAECSVEMFRENVRQYMLTFPGTPPEAPRIPGILRQYRTERELVLTLVNPAESTIDALKALKPALMSDSPLGLEEAFISYLDEGDEASFLPERAKGSKAK